MKKYLLLLGCCNLFFTAFSQSTIIGTTTYDVQTNDGSKNRIHAYDDGTISASWVGSSDPTSAFTDRGMFYTRFNGATWGAFPAARIETQRTGFGELIQVNDHEAILSHYFDGVAYNMRVYTNTTIGGTTWTETAGSGLVSGLWAFSDSPAGTDDIYMVCANANPPTAFNFSRSDDGGNSWSVLNSELPFLSTADGFPYEGGAAESYQIKVHGADVYVLFGMPTSDIVLLHSNDYGNPGSWTSTTVLDFPYANFDGLVQTDLDADGITDTVQTNDGMYEMLMEDDGTVQIFAGYYRIYSDGFGYIYNPRASGIWHWKTGMAGAELINTELDISSPDGGYNPYGGIGAYYFNYRNAGVSSSPAASWDPVTGRLYLLYTMKMEYTDIYDDPTNPSAESFRDIYGIYSDDDGATWTAPTNMTNTAGAGEENFYLFTADRVVDGKISAVWQQDDQPGHFNEGDLIHSNNIRYQGFTDADFAPVCDPTVAPVGLYADEITSNSATLHWTAAPAASQYTISFWNVADPTHIGKRHLNDNFFHIHTGGLTPSTTYGFRIKTTCYESGEFSPNSDVYYFTTGPGKIGDFSEESVLVFPNPAKDIVNVVLNDDLLNGQVELYNVLGSRMNVPFTTSENIVTLDVNNLPSGNYFVKIWNNEGQVVKPLVKE